MLRIALSGPLTHEPSENRRNCLEKKLLWKSFVQEIPLQLKNCWTERAKSSKFGLQMSWDYFDEIGKRTSEMRIEAKSYTWHIFEAGCSFTLYIMYRNICVIVLHYEKCSKRLTSDFRKHIVKTDFEENWTSTFLSRKLFRFSIAESVWWSSDKCKLSR